MVSPTVSGEEPALTYRNLRAIIGDAGLALPVTLFLTGLVDGHVESSLSAYYYTRVGPIFTGAVCVIGVFLIAYRIRAWAWDSIITTIAGIAAFGVAFFHALPPHPTAGQRELADVHLTCAAILFILLGAISVLIFPYTEDPPERPWRANTYRALGALIWLAIILMPILNAVAQPYYGNDRGFFILETMCVTAFSVSFILKGHSKPPARRPVPVSAPRATAPPAQVSPPARVSPGDQPVLGEPS
jgi:hypothetical protein